MKKKIVQKTLKAWEVKMKVKKPKKRRTDKQLEAAAVKDLKSVAISKMIDMIPVKKRAEFIGLFDGIRINQSEVQKVSWTMIANKGFAKGKSIEESIVKGELSGVVITALFNLFWGIVPSKKRKK
jgi:hypothetical protein